MANFANCVESANPHLGIDRNQLDIPTVTPFCSRLGLCRFDSLSSHSFRSLLSPDRDVLSVCMWTRTCMLCAAVSRRCSQELDS